MPRNARYDGTDAEIADDLREDIDAFAARIQELEAERDAARRIYTEALSDKAALRDRLTRLEKAARKALDWPWNYDDIEEADFLALKDALEPTS